MPLADCGFKINTVMFHVIILASGLHGLVFIQEHRECE